MISTPSNQKSHHYLPTYSVMINKTKKPEKETQMENITIGLPVINNYDINHFIDWYGDYMVDVINNPIKGDN